MTMDTDTKPIDAQGKAPDLKYITGNVYRASAL